MTTDKSLLSFGLESIDFQNDDFLAKLADVIEKYRWLKNKSENESLISEVSDLIKRRFNLNVTTNLVSNHFQASVVFPVANHNSSGVTISQRNSFSNNLSRFDVAAFSKLVSSSNGWMDKKKAKVYGFYAEQPVFLILGTSLLTYKDFTAAELATFIGHELGHTWTSFSRTLVIQTITAGLSELQQTFAGLTSPEEIRVILNDLTKVGYIDINTTDISTVVTLPTDKIVSFIAANRTIMLSSQTGNAEYENKALEQSADLFVARLGGAKDLASGLDKLNTTAGLKRTKLCHYSIQVAKLVGNAIMLFTPWLILGVESEHEKEYDDPVNRLEKLKQQTLILLKNPSLDSFKVQACISDINTIEALIKTYKNNVGIQKIAALILSSKYRGQKRQNELMYHLERMSNNDLFTVAAKLKSLT